MNNSFKIFGVFLLGASLCLAQEKLSHLPGVSYEYLAEDGRVLPKETFKDKTGKYLTDGKTGDKESAVSEWKDGSEKTMRVRFSFPVPVSPIRVRVGWSWTFEQPKHWIDSVSVIADDGTELAKEEVHGVEKAHHVWIDVPVPPGKRTRSCTVAIRQNGAAGHCFFGIGEVIIEGSAEDAALLQEYGGSAGQLRLGHIAPINLLTPADSLDLPVSVKCEGGKAGTLRWRFTDCDGGIADEGQVPLTLSGEEATGRITGAPLPVGYYDLECTAEIESAATGGLRRFTGRSSLLVQPRIERTSEESLAAGARFGIQTNFINEEIHQLFDALGLPWRRNMLFFAPQAGKNPDAISWDWLDKKIAGLQGEKRLFLFEIKTVPQWLRTPGDKSTDWFLRMPTDLAKYGDFIAAQVARLPERYQRFELWNEPWGHYSAEEFARLTSVMRDAIRRVKPNAKMGPNLGPLTHLKRYIAAGGMEGMDYLTIHPYAMDFHSSPESAGLADTIRAYQKLLREDTGREIPLIVTEIGWPTTPKGRTHNTELEQAQYTVRACLLMSALGVREIMPYAAGQPEKREDNMEDWFGFVRKDLTPKPVLAAYATMARKIEGCAFLGHLTLHPDVHAPLFRKPDGTLLAALWADGKSLPVFLPCAAEKLRCTALMGRESILPTPHGRCSLRVTPSVLYLEGLGEEALSLCQANSPAPSTRERAVRKAPRLSGDAAQADWSQIPSETLSAGDATLRWQIAHDGTALHVRVQVKDPHPGTSRFGALDLWRGDCIELFVCADPEKRIPGFTGETDFQILASPFGVDGTPKMVCCDEIHRNTLPKGVTARWQTTPDGYAGILTIPFAAIGAPAGTKELAFDLMLDDLCPTHGRAFAASNQRDDNNTNAALWRRLQLLP